MLNELSELYKSLQAQGVDVAATHPSIKTVRKAPFLRVVLGKKGVESVSAWAVGEMPVYAAWTLRDGQQNSFPSIKVDLKGDCPLIAGGPFDEELRMLAKGEEINADGKKVSVEQDRQITAIDRLVSNGVDKDAVAKWPGYLPRIVERTEELSSLQGSEAESVWRTFDRFSALAESPELLFESLFSVIRKLLKKNDELFTDLVASLIVDGSAQLYFDAATSDERPIGHVESRGLVAEALFGNESSVAGHDGLCMLSGVESRLHEGNYPQPNLPYLGQTYLYSRNADTPAGHRYGSTTQSVGRDIVAKLGGALDNVTQGDSGNTWERLPSEKDGQIDLLIAYPTDGSELPLATLLAGSDAAVDFEDDDDDLDGPIEPRVSRNTFEAACQKVFEALSGKPANDCPDVRVVILRQVDPANRKAVFNRTLSARELQAAAERWEGAFASRLLPDTTILLPGKKGAKARQRQLHSFPPLRNIALSRKSSRRGGTEIQSVIGLPAQVALDAFCSQSPEQPARRLLGRLVKQLSDVASGYAAALRRSAKESHAFDATTALNLLSSVHVLLNVLARPGDCYMSDTAFKLGQFLAGCDMLHLGYCIDQRGGSIPPKLIGNAMMAMAGRRPVSAFDVLQRRLPVYQAWAIKASAEGQKHPNEESNKADKERRWSVVKGMSAARQLKPLASDIGPRLQEVHPDDVFRAELLLGYVAGPDKPAKGESGDVSGEQEAEASTTTA